MDEATARMISAARAIETRDPDRAWWTDADRAWASRAAGEIVGAQAPPQRFVARRAALVLERAGERQPAVQRAVAALAWRAWIAPAVLLVAFLAGLTLDQVAPSGRVDILAPPVLGLMTWNVVVYLVLAATALRGRKPGRGHGMQAVLARLGARLPRLRGMRSAGAAPAAAIAAFVQEWSAQAAPLYGARAARILHLGAAALALGVIVALYVRGLALEYRAGWESTFLDARGVHAIVAAALAPGAMLTGLAVPDVAHVAAIRRDVLPGGENAARWVHLYAASVLLVVIVPRLLLALLAWLVERRRLRALGPDLDAPYFRRVLRDFSAAPLRVVAVPYSYAVAPATQARLAELVARALGAAARLTVAPSVPYGSEDALPPGTVPPQTDVAIALFNAVATPEPATQGAFVAALRALGAPEVVALVDDAALRARWPADAKRLDARHEAWRAVLEPHAVPLVFVDLAQADLADAEAALGRAVGQPA